MDTRIRPLLDRYADFDFRIDTDQWEVVFSREVPDGDGHRTEDGIKISRGEENIFIWCFFLAIVQLALDGAEAYDWVKYVYIDDPISSMDEQNAIAVATHLARMLKKEDSTPEDVVISTHHTLFFNVLFNELKASDQVFSVPGSSSRRLLAPQHGRHAILPSCGRADIDLYEVERSGEIYTHHFNMLRAIMEKTASFHGHANFPTASSNTKTISMASCTPDRQPAEPRQLLAL